MFKDFINTLNARPDLATSLWIHHLLTHHCTQPWKMWYKPSGRWAWLFLATHKVVIGMFKVTSLVGKESQLAGKIEIYQLDIVELLQVSLWIAVPEIFLLWSCIGRYGLGGCGDTRTSRLCALVLEFSRWTVGFVVFSCKREDYIYCLCLCSEQ